MRIIETGVDFEEWFTALPDHTPLFILPIFKDLHAHPAVNPLAVLYVRSVDTEPVLLPFDHMDGIPLPSTVLDRLKGFTGDIFTPFKKDLLHAGFDSHNVHDLAAMEYLTFNTTYHPEKLYPDVMRQMLRKYEDETNVMDTVPLLAIGEFGDRYSRVLKDLTAGFEYRGPQPNAYSELNMLIIPTLFEMERAGIHVDEDLYRAKWGRFKKRSISNGLVYTRYNPYSTTGRITSNFGGVNYVALNKSDGTRKIFTSRFEKEGMMVLIDFESFHLRLMANDAGYDLPNEPVHEYLGKLYFQKDSLTKEEYEQGKEITFQLLYSDDRQDVDIPFIKRIYEYTDDVWATFKRQGRIEMRSGRIFTPDHIEDPSPAKLFNYVLQLREMEVGMESIRRAVKVLKTAESKIVLYTYDSVLIDVHKHEAYDILPQVVHALNQNGKYPVRVYYGESYDQMQKLNVNFEEFA